MVAPPVQRRSKHRRQGIRHERPADHRHRRPPADLRFRRCLFSRRQSRRHHTRSISTALRATGATSSPSSAASSPASRSARPARTPAVSRAPHVLEQQISAILRHHIRRRRRPRPAQGLHQRESAPLARRALVRRRRHSPHRLRQPLQSSSRPRRRAHQGVRHAHRARRQPRCASCANCSPKASSSPAPERSSDSRLAATLIAWLRHQGASRFPCSAPLHIDGAALGWTVLIAIVAAVPLRPAPRSAHGFRQSAGLLKDSGAGSGQGRKHERLRSILVVTEVALACVLLVGAGLLLRSFVRVLDVDLGFQPAARRRRQRRLRRQCPQRQDRRAQRGQARRDLPAGHQPRQRHPRRPGRRHLRLSAPGPEPLLGIALAKRRQAARQHPRLAARLRHHPRLYARHGHRHSRPRSHLG